MTMLPDYNTTSIFTNCDDYKVDEIVGYELLDCCETIKNHESISKRINATWGTEDFLETVTAILLPRDNVTHPLPGNVVSELMLLHNAFSADPIACAHPNNTASENKRIAVQIANITLIYNNN